MTLTDRVAALLKARAPGWVDGRELARVGGYAGYRWRITELRWRGVQIGNRQRVVRKRNGTTVKVSEYRLERPA